MLVILQVMIEEHQSCLMQLFSRETDPSILDLDLDIDIDIDIDIPARIHQYQNL